MPTLLNVTVDSVVRHWISLMVEDEAVIQEGLGHAVGQKLRVFYVYDGILGSRDPEWIQGSLNVLVGMFQGIGLVANIAKLKTMACHPGVIRSGM